MEKIKTYQQVNRQDELKSFGISRMEEIYARHQGQPDHPHRHNYYTVLLVEEAEGQHFIDFKEYPLSGNQVFFIGPGQVHQIIEEKASIGFSMVFSSQFLAENNIPVSFIEDLNLFHDYGHSPPLEINEDERLKLSHYAKEIEAYHKSAEKLKERAIGALMELFLIACNNICTLPEDDPQQLEARNSLLRNFRELLDEHHTSWHSTSQYAEALFITPDHLNRTVKALTGKTAKEYIQSRIIVAAKRLLYFSDLSAKGIGYELGFSEPGNFSAFFKKCTGQSPSQFRKQR